MSPFTVAITTSPLGSSSFPDKIKLSLIIENFDKERLNELILTKFENRKDFSIIENGYNLVNVVTETEENLYVFDDHLELEYKAKRSQFYEFLTIFYPNLFSINENSTNRTSRREKAGGLLSCQIYVMALEKNNG